MSSFNPGGGGGVGSNNGNAPNYGVSQAQMDEIKSFNASLTQAGNKSRPSRSRGSGVNRGLGSGISPGRGGGYGGASNASRSGSGAGCGANSSYSVGPSTPSPIAKPVQRENVPIHLQGRIDASKTRWANLDSTGAGTLGGHSIGPVNSAVTPSPKTRSRSPTRSSILVSHSQHVPANTVSQQPAVTQTLQSLQTAQVIPPPGRQRIVTNMTPDDPTKPFIPAHLHQTSCRVAIEEISRMTGLPLSDVTSNGISIPAARPRDSAETMASPTGAFAPVSAPRQPDVDQQVWLKNAKNKNSNTEANMAVNTPNMAVNTPNMAVNTPNMQPMLSESRWAPEADTATPHNGFAASFAAPPASFPAPTVVNHSRVLSGSAMDLEMTGSPSILDTPLETLSIDPMNAVLTAMPTLAESRWATPGTLTTNRNVRFGASSQVSAAINSNVGFGASQVPATSHNNARFGAFQFPDTTHSNAGFGASSQAPWPTSTDASGWPSANERPPLAEVAPSNPSSYPTKSGLSPANTSAAWGIPFHCDDVAPPTRSWLRPNTSPVAPTTDSGTTQGFIPHHLRTGLPPGYVPTHLRNAPLKPPPPPSWSTENDPPVSTPSPPKKEEKKVAYLKDSRWAC